MAVLKSKDDKELVITCDCGCDNGIHFKVDRDDETDMYCIMAFMNGNFYRDQNEKILSVIMKKLKKIWAIVRNKDYYYSDIIVNKQEYEEFKEYINKF